MIEDKENGRKYHNTVARPLLCLKKESTHASRTFLAYEMLALMQRTFTVNSTLLLNVHLGAKAWTRNINLSSIHWLCHSGYITVMEPYQLLCYGSNFSKLLLAGWFEIWPRNFDFHSAKQPTI